LTGASVTPGGGGVPITPPVDAPTARGYLDLAERAHLEDVAYRIRRLVIEMVSYGQWGHMAGSVSMAEMLAALYFHTARLDPDHPAWPERDRIVLSKAHTSPGLALAGFFPIEELYRYCDQDGILEGHSDMTRTPGLESSGGLLGMGLSVAQGMAFAARIAMGACSASWATASSTKATCGKRRCPPPTTGSQASSPSWTRTASCPRAVSRSTWASNRSPTSGVRSDGR
jgi:hypothetical protein